MLVVRVLHRHLRVPHRLRPILVLLIQGALHRAAAAVPVAEAAPVEVALPAEAAAEVNLLNLFSHALLVFNSNPFTVQS